MFSIQTASTGPSKMYQRESRSVDDDPKRIRDDKIPSVLEKDDEKNYGGKI